MQAWVRADEDRWPIGWEADDAAAIRAVYQATTAFYDVTILPLRSAG